MEEYEYFIELNDNKTGEKYLFFLNEEKRKIMGKLIPSKGRTIKRIIKCDKNDVWDPIIAVSLVKFKLEIGMKRYTKDVKKKYGWKHMKEFVKKGISRPDEKTRRTMNAKRREERALTTYKKIVSKGVCPNCGSKIEEITGTDCGNPIKTTTTNKCKNCGFTLLTDQQI